MPKEAFDRLWVSTVSMIRPGHDEGAVLRSPRPPRCASRSRCRRPRSRARSRPPARRGSAGWCGRSAPSRCGRSPRSPRQFMPAPAPGRRRCPRASPAGSARPEHEAGGREVAQQRGDAGALRRGVVGVLEARAVVDARRACSAASDSGIVVDRALQLDRHVLAAHAAHQRRLLLDEQDAAAVDHRDAVGHRLGLLDVVGGEDDRRAAGAQVAHDVPHALAELDVDPGGRLVEEQHLRPVRQRLGDQHPAHHAARELLHLGVALVPEASLVSSSSSQASSGGLPNSARV